ncbi:MAG: ribbon-helix-helix protein, CopG family [Elusimicrobia bacterium]|nr:ribbon-helix-helix protein, CopG family [Elusimicrobiota bacterium]
MDYKYTYQHTGEVKSKVTLTLAPGLLKRLDEMAVEMKAKSRSDLMENVLRQWLALQARRQLESDTELYYRSVGKKEADEAKDWAKISQRGAARLWD